MKGLSKHIKLVRAAQKTSSVWKSQRFYTKTPIAKGWTVTIHYIRHARLILIMCVICTNTYSSSITFLKDEGLVISVKST